MTLQTFTARLPLDTLFVLAGRMTRLALPIWDTYADKNELFYIDTVVGISHSVDRHLLSKTVDVVEEYLHANQLRPVNDSKLLELYGQYDDPIVALQDNDWDLPEEVKKTFYSVYNLLRALLGHNLTHFDESAIYVSINQSIDAIETAKIMTFEEINNILVAVKHGR